MGRYCRADDGRLSIGVAYVSDLAEPLPGVPLAKNRHRYVGYSLYLTAAFLFALNGTVSKTILLTGVSASRLTQLRVTAACVVLLIVIAASRPAMLKIKRTEIGKLIAYAVLGVSMTQYLYFVALQTLNVGIALLIEFTAPIMVALWFRFGRKDPVNRLVWLALLIALVGLAMVAQVWQGFTLDTFGVMAAFGAAAALALYYVMGEDLVTGKNKRDPVSLTMWGFAFGAVFWAIVQPWWSFPWSAFQGSGQPLAGSGPEIPLWFLVTWMIVLGTVVPFWLVVSSMRHITASQASVIGMSEPLLATGVAWIALGEAMTPVQIVGAFVVLAGVLLAEKSR